MSLSDYAKSMDGVEGDEEVDTPRGDEKLPPKDEVVAKMKEALKERCQDVDKKNPVNPEEYFSEKHIAPCFWTPRKEEYGGPSPWLDDALFIFAHSRAFDYATGSKRFFKFNKAAYDTGLISLDEMSEDVAHCLSVSGCYQHSPEPDQEGRPVVYMSCRFFSWDHFTVKAAQRAHIWLFWRWAILWGQVAQTRGISFVMCMEGMHMGQVKMEFETWCDKLFIECMPIKIAAMYMAYEPFWFGNIMWPMMKMGMKKKMRERVYWMGTKKEKVGPKYLEHAYKVPRGQPDEKNYRAQIPEEMGGSSPLTPDTCEKYFKGTFKISDEPIPEGCWLPKKEDKKK